MNVIDYFFTILMLLSGEDEYDDMPIGHIL